MKQVIRRGLKEIIVDEVADPVVSPNHVLVRSFFSLISTGTETADIHTDNIVKEVADNPSHLKTVWNVMMKTDPISTINEVRAKFKDYAVLGYSGAGIVIEKHDSVSDLEIGQRVSYGGEGTGHGETISVGRNLVARVPAEVSLRDACFTTLGSIAMNAVRQAEIGVGESVAVVGLGIVGQLVTQLVRCQGGIVLAIDLQKARVDAAIETGADFGLTAGESTVEDVKKLTEGRGADCVIVAAASKSSIAVQQAAQMSRDRGRIVMVGAVPLDLPRSEMYIKELRLLMARAYGPGSYDQTYEKQGIDYPLPYVRWTENRNMEEFLRLIANGKVNVKSLVSHEFPVDDAPKAYETVMDTESSSLAVLLKYPAADDEDPVASFVPNRKIIIENQSLKAEDKLLNFALIGAGNLAKWAHLPALRKISGARLRAVYSSNGARGKSYALRFNAAYSTSEFEEILTDKEVDVVLIASRHKEHAQQAIAALNAGKHVFLEKPMAISLDECRRISQAVRDSGKRLTVGFNRRFAPFYLEMKGQLSRRTGPAIVSVRMNSPGIEKGWAGEPDQGGVVVGEGCHFVDLMYWLLDSEPVSVTAYGFDQHNVAASIKFADGSVGNFIYTVIGGEAGGGELVEAYAPGVSVSTEDFKRLAIRKKTVNKSSKWFAQKGYFTQLESFVNNIQQGMPDGVSVVDGIRATLGCLLMLESARSGKEQTFDLDAISK